MKGSKSVAYARFSMRNTSRALLLSIVADCASSSRRAATEQSVFRPLPRCSASAHSVPRDSVPEYQGTRPPESLEVRVSRSVPGGLTSYEGGPTGRLVVQMVDTAQADTVRSALADAFNRQGNPAFAERIRNANVRPVAFSAADVADWHTYLTTLLYNDAAHEHVAISGVGADFHNVRVVIAVPTQTQRAWVEGRLARANIPCGLVQTEINGGFHTSAEQR